MKTADSEALPPGREASWPGDVGGTPPPPLVRLRRGDPGALAEILDRHWEGCVLYARSLLDRADREDLAEDLAQEAFVRLWENRERLDSDIGPRPFLLRVLRNLVLNEERRLDVTRRWAHRVEESQRRLNPTPHHHLRAREVRVRAQRAVKALPPRRREIFLLVRFQGLSYLEVAEVMDISRQTVANQMSSALEALREALEPHL